MTTIENRPNTALLVVDVQNGVVARAHQRDAVVANVGSLVEKARREQVPVVWIQHSDEQTVRGSGAWRTVPELAPGDGEPLVEKNRGGAPATALGRGGVGGGAGDRGGGAAARARWGRGSPRRRADVSGSSAARRACGPSV